MTKPFLRDLLERTLTTYVEALLGFLLLADALDASRLKLAGVAALPAAFSAAKAILLEFLDRTPAPTSIGWDLLERMAATYVVTFLGLVIVNPGEVAVYRLAATSALPAALAVLKGLLALRVGHRNASLDPDVTTPRIAL